MNHAWNRPMLSKEIHENKLKVLKKVTKPPMLEIQEINIDKMTTDEDELEESEFDNA